MKEISIKLPEEIVSLLEKDETLRDLVENLVTEEVKEYILKILTLDKLAEESKLTMEDIERIDKEVKKRLRQRIEYKAGNRHE